MTEFAMLKDINGFNSFGLQFNNPAYTYSATLTTSTATPLTIPTGSANTRWLAIMTFTPGSEVWVANNTTAAAPAGAPFAATASHQLPTPREVIAGDVLSFFTTGTAVSVGVMLYALRDK